MTAVRLKLVLESKIGCKFEELDEVSLVGLVLDEAHV